MVSMPWMRLLPLLRLSWLVASAQATFTVTSIESSASTSSSTSQGPGAGAAEAQRWQRRLQYTGGGWEADTQPPFTVISGDCVTNEDGSCVFGLKLFGIIRDDSVGDHDAQWVVERHDSGHSYLLHVDACEMRGAESVDVVGREAALVVAGGRLSPRLPLLRGRLVAERGGVVVVPRTLRTCCGVLD